MRNIRIEVKRENYIVVVADSLRFGKNEIMFEGNTFSECFDYVKRETNKQKLWLNSRFIYDTYKDREGRIFPVFMQVNS